MPIMNDKELRQKLLRKYVLLDACVLMEASKQPDAFIELFRLLDETGCIPVLFPLVEFEFLRNAFLKEEKAKLRSFLETFSIETLSMNPPDKFMERTARIASWYASQRLAPDLTDCAIATLLEQYADKLFLVTFNHQHFPKALFNRFHLMPTETKTGPMVAGFYEFDTERAEAFAKRFPA
ncbi:hypothetical protein A2856_03525 [Candidatus Uhrbacteria bacterium RIFCSPHIGHO2_01_FULL_63_20]|uniref:PIN domain-containing protein n=1 Tax=Candidatus Uhrbacteria bacterium RIFCSPHIGHO2_01_FULL_63_20 TaxID=1802385 RepID=A0A1F7TL30_9BACT|nr:MAG: hypothetical protein A2856_03525 [Candidatus Uhrbacteria bacterium RIFCSPHIGHO2_01_FULL_63_20]